ncbi:MAG: PAS domain-containing protein [Gammaproteobacteria bacterium]
MATKPLDAAIVGDTASAVDFITNILQASTEYSITGKSLDGTILLCNECARRPYGYEPGEVIGKANSSILHVSEDVRASKPGEILNACAARNLWAGWLNVLLRWNYEGTI